MEHTESQTGVAGGFGHFVSTKSVIAGLALAGVVAVLACALGSVPPLHESAFALLVLAVSAIAWGVTNWQPGVGRWFTLAVILALLLLANAWLGVPLSLAMLAIPTGLAAAMIGVTAAAGLALAQTALLIVTPQVIGASIDPAATFLVLTAIWGTLGTVWAICRGVTQRAEWLSDYLQSSQHVVEDARRRQAELEQLREDWSNTTRQLALANERLTALRLIAEDARESQASFVAKVSHEFRTPLNIIIGMVNLMVESPELYEGEFPPRALAQLEIVYRNCEHLSSMIDDVLDLTQVEAGRMPLRREYVDLADIIDSAVGVVRPMIVEKGLDLRVAVPDDVPEIYCDRIRIRQVILNLLSNAARFTEEGRISVAATGQDQRVVVSVADTGPGIPAEDAERIFEPFRQAAAVPWRDRGGSGLGLSISKEFVQLHSGRMWLESEVGRGSTFFVELPHSRPSDHSARPERWIKGDWIWGERAFRTERSGLVDQPFKPRVVVCDQTGDLHSAFARHSDEVEFVDTEDLAQAAQELERCPAQALMLNAASPKGLLSLVEMARREVCDTPIIGGCCPPSVKHALEAGALDYLTKPVTRADLKGAIEAVGRPVRRILILDDEADARELLAFYVRAYDDAIEVVETESSEQALRELHGPAPDLILLDLLLPGMDGWQFLALKNEDETLRDIPTVIISAQDARQGPLRSELVLATIGEGLSFSKLLDCSRELAALLMRPG